MLTKLSHHHKTITCLRVGYDGKKILSGSLDRHVNVYDIGSYNKVHTFNYPNSILSLGISKDGTIAAGMIDGMISIMKREEKSKEEDTVNKKKISFRSSGQNLYNIQNNTLIPQVNKTVMSKHDACLRKFEYSKALDIVMGKYTASKNPHVTAGVFYELCRRQGLYQALAGRQGKSLVNIINFLIKHIGNINFSRVIIDAINIFIDVYEDQIDKMEPEVKQKVIMLKEKLKEELDLISSLMDIQGRIELLLSSGEIASVQPNNKSHDLVPSMSAVEI